MDMDIHFSDEEDYNSDSESVWDEEEIKAGGKAVKKSKQDSEKEEKEDDDNNSNADIEEKEDAEESDAEEDNDNDKDGDSDGDEDSEGEENGDEDEYYPEEDAGDKEEIIVKEEDRITSDVLSKYEIVELISIRSTQISKGDMPFTDVSGLRDPISMAKKEIYDNRCPLLVKRHIGNNMYEYWNPNNMSKPKI